MARPLGRTIAAVLLASLAAPAVADDGALARGAAAYRNGQISTARIELLNAIKDDPANPVAHLLQARVYLAISTLAMHYAIVFLCTTYQANFGASASAGITIADPVIGSLRLRGEHAWYYFLLVLVTLFTAGCVNLVRTRPGRAWMAIRDRDIAAEALGINLTRYKLAAFMLSAMLASVSGSLAAYYSNVVTVEGYTLDLAVIYVAMIIVGGMGSVLGGLLGAIFITLLPYAIDSLFEFLPRAWRFGSTVFGVQVGAVGVCIILFLLFEPKGLAEIWRRTETYFDRWPFRYRPLDTTRR